MNKKLITFAVAAAMAAPLAVQAGGNAGPTVYGKIDFSVEHDNDSTSNAVADENGWTMERNGSHFGIKGSEDLGNGLSAIYKIEYGIDGATDSARNTDTNATDLYQRNTYVGLAGGFGTFLMGKHDTPYKMAASKLDPFGNTTADQANEYFAERRLGSVLAYISPKIAGGLTLAGAVSLAEGTGAAMVGTKRNDAEDLNDVYSLAAMYSNGPIFASIAYEVINDDTWDMIAGASGADDEERIRVGVGYTLDALKLAAVYADVENVGGAKGIDDDAFRIYATYSFGNTVVKAGYGQIDFDISGASDLDHDSWTVGVDHNLSKRTKAYAIYDAWDSDTRGNDYDTFAVGLSHKF